MSWSSVLLLFAVAIAAWVLGRRYDRVKETKASAERAKRYFKGLSYVLSDQPDKAIDSFVELLKVDDETVDTHFALGSLYRKRGEIERAIRIHQNIIARPLLPSAHRSHASYELGLDYFSAGLLDRAEAIFLEMQHDALYRRTCLRELLALYQLTQEWDKAVAIASSLRDEGVTDAVPAIAHFYCELAQMLRKQQKVEPALAQLQSALQIDPLCARASLLRAEILAEQSLPADALAALAELVQQDASLLSEALPILNRLKISSEQRTQLLGSALEAGAGASAVLALAEEMRTQYDDRIAGEFLLQQLQKRPSLRELLRLVDLHVNHAHGSTRTQLAVLQDVLQKLVARLPVYRCQRCGFHGRQLHWRCPGCRQWNTVRPITGIEGE